MCVVALCALCAGFNASARDASRQETPSEKKTEKIHLTERQKELLGVYCSKRWWSICYLKLCGQSLTFDTSLDQLRPVVLKKLKLPSKATWTDVVTHEKIAKHFAAWDRATVGEVLCGDKNATWDCIIKMVESLRLRKKSGEVGSTATGLSPFSFAENGYTIEHYYIFI